MPSAPYWRGLSEMTVSRIPRPQIMSAVQPAMPNTVMKKRFL